MSEHSRAPIGSVFDAVADRYDVRPGYPPAVFDDVAALARLGPDARVLEVGCGTGQATRALLARGWRVTAVELGADVAAAARARLPGLDVRVGAFEELPLPAGAFDLVFAATAWHWIDAARGAAAAATALRPRGALALVWNEHVAGDGDDFFAAVQDLYEDAGMARHRLTPATALPDRSAALVAGGHFGDVVRRRHPWRATYDAATYVTLLSTYSDHIRLAPAVRARLLDGIAALIDGRFGGRIVKHYVADLYVARRVL